ncbi:hypothetical protein XELAEV_180380582mg, partial [Xenopus laevis]
DEQEHEFYK